MHRYPHWPIHLMLSFISALMLLPFVWVLKTSLTGENIFTYPPSILPEDPHLFYYVDVWYSIPFFRYLINSEPHIDHFAGNYFFDGTVVAHEGTREAVFTFPVERLKEIIGKEYPDSLRFMDEYTFRPPSITCSQDMQLYVGDHTFHLIHLPGHTPYQMAVYIPQEKVIFSADNVFCNVQAWLQDALPYQWLNSLEKIEELDVDVIVPGHGNICDRKYIPEMKAFIQEWIDAVLLAIKQGMSLEQAQNEINFLDRYPMQAGVVHAGQRVQRANVARLYHILHENIRTEFRGFKVSDMTFTPKAFNCKDCPNQCEVTYVEKDDGEVIARWGDRCGKWSM